MNIPDSIVMLALLIALIVVPILLMEPTRQDQQVFMKDQKWRFKK